MRRYLLSRLLQMVPMLLGVTVISFVIIQTAPGGLASFTGADSALSDPTRAEALRRLYGFDQPLLTQYLKWLGRMLVGDFGRSLVEGRPVMAIYLERLPNTLYLGGLGVLGIYLLAVPIGVAAAVRQYSRFDYAVTTIAFAGEALPGFLLALVLLYAVALPSHGVIPLGGIATYGVRLGEAGFWLVVADRGRHLALPLLVTVFGGLTGLTRYMRASMLEVLREEYVTTARSKGLSERVVIYRHALRNALLPVVTLAGQILPAIFGGSVVVEQIFSWPGVGLMSLHAVLQRDYPVIMATLTLSSVVTLLSYLLVDLLYTRVDPRIQYN